MFITLLCLLFALAIVGVAGLFCRPLLEQQPATPLLQYRRNRRRLKHRLLVVTLADRRLASR